MVEEGDDDERGRAAAVLAKLDVYELPAAAQVCRAWRAEALLLIRQGQVILIGPNCPRTIEEGDDEFDEAVTLLANVAVDAALLKRLDTLFVDGKRSLDTLQAALPALIQRYGVVSTFAVVEADELHAAFLFSSYISILDMSGHERQLICFLPGYSGVDMRTNESAMYVVMRDDVVDRPLGLLRWIII